MQVKKALQTCPLSLSNTHTHTSIYPNSHQSLLRFPKVRILLQASLEILKPLLQSAQWHESLCGVGHHLRLLHGKRRSVVEETLQHFGGELHERGDGRLAGGGHWRLLSPAERGAPQRFRSGPGGTAGGPGSQTGSAYQSRCRLHEWGEELQKKPGFSEHSAPNR